MVATPENPITGICIVSDKDRCPPNFEVIAKAHDDASVEADVWKDGFFALTRIYRYLCVCRTVPANAFVCNVVADITISNDKDVVPPGFIPIELTEDTREKALRKKQVALRLVPRESAVDAVTDVVLLTRQKRPPTGYTLAGEIDGVVFCFKYGVIPADFPANAVQGQASVCGDLPYALHPSASNPTNLQQPYHPDDGRRQAASMAANGLHNLSLAQMEPALQRQVLVQRQTSTSAGRSGIDGVPFELHSKLKLAMDRGQGGLPPVKEISLSQLESEFAYTFRVEQQVLEYN